MRKTTVMTTVFLMFAASGAAMADDDDCYVPMDRWQPREAVQKMAEARGWTVQRIKTDDGCYEIRGLDEKGRAIKAKIDPGSLAIVKMKRKGRDNDRRGDYRQTAPARDIAPPSNGLFGGKSAPKVEVK